MNLSTWSIKNPIPVVMFFILLTMAGILSFSSTKVQNFPDIEMPTVVVTTVLPGAAPAQMETEVARKIENAVATLQNIKHIYSTSVDGTATVSVQFELEKNISDAVDEVRDAVGRIRSDLPSNVRDPVFSKVEFSSTPFLAYTISNTQIDEESLSWFIDNIVTKKLLSVKGVGSVTRVGGVDREIRIEIDPIKLNARNITAADVSRRIAQVQQEASGGRVTLNATEQSIRTIGTLKTAEELAALEIPINNGRSVRLDQIATISDTIAERRAVALLNGKSAIGIELTRSKGASEPEVHDKVKLALAELEKEHPNLTMTEAYNMANPVRENYHGSMQLLLEGAFLAIIVVFWFLRDWRATLVSATALPLSVIPTFIGLQYFGFSLNVVTLLALSLVIGVLVDDAIVEIENIMRHINQGKTPYDAAKEAAEEIGLAVVATTFTLIAVFLPTAFMSGIVGKFFKQFGWPAAISVFASLVVARLLTPMMAAYVLKAPKKIHEVKDSPSMRWYLNAVKWCLNYRFITTIITAIFFVGCMMLTKYLPQGFIPADNSSQTVVKIELPPGTTLDQTYRQAEKAREIISKNPHVKLVYTAIGGGNAGGDPFAVKSSDVRIASLTLTLTDRHLRPKKQDIEHDLRRELSGLTSAKLFIGLGSSGEQYQFVLKSEDPVALQQTAKNIERDLRTIPNIGGITTSSGLQKPELVIKPDFAKAADLGVTSQAIADTIRVATVGDYDTALAKLNLSQRQIPIMVRLSENERNNLETIKHLQVPGSKGSILLGNIAQISLEQGPTSITRQDRIRNVVFTVELNGVPLGEVTKQTETLPSFKNIPGNVKLEVFGDAEEQQNMQKSFGIAMLTGVFCIYVVLVLLFKEFTQPLTILGALILSIPGAFLALFITKTAVSMPSMIGMIMLIGIATKNSILLVEYAIVAQRDQGMTRFEALVDACYKRARPIVMTTIAMGAGMLPIAIGIGVDSSFRAPMAIVVIGGLITSTFLSLLVIPVIYTFVDDIVKLTKRLFSRESSPKLNNQTN